MEFAFSNIVSREKIISLYCFEFVFDTYTSSQLMQDDDERIAAIIKELQSLRLRENALIAQVEAINNTRRTQGVDDSGEFEEVFVFEIGDRVRIENQVNRPATWTGPWTPQIIEQYRRGVVTRVTRTRVYLRNKLNLQVYRAPNNISHRPDETGTDHEQRNQAGH